MVRPDVVASKVARPRTWLNDAAQWIDGSVEDFRSDSRGRDLATALRGATGLRNRIAHGYALLDYERVHREARVGIPAIRQFLAVIAAAAGL